MNATIIGLGYVGLPLAIRLTQIGFSVNAIDKDILKISSLKRGKLPFALDEPHLEEFFKKARHKIKFLGISEKYESTGLIFVAIDTPLIGTKPNNIYITKASKYLSKNLKKGTIVIIESTIAPKTAKNLIIPLIEKETSMKINKDFYLAVAPERIRPKYIFKQLTTLPRVIGVSSNTIIPKLKYLYKKITSGEIDFTDLTTAETVKTVENTFRDVNIAFANQIALACEELGVNVWKVRELVNKSPFHNLHKPGTGVGGHCIPKDPWLLLSSVGTEQLSIVKEARDTNDSMPAHLFELVKLAFKQKKIDQKKAKVCVLGYSYVEDTDDVRNSPSQMLLDLFKLGKIKYTVHDPNVDRYNKELLSKIKDSDCIVLAVGHKEYKNLRLKNLAKLVNKKVLIDGRNFFDKQIAEKYGFIYKGIGNI